MFEYVDTIKESGKGLEIETGAGDGLYFIAANKEAYAREVTVRIKLKNAKSKDNETVAEYFLFADKYGSAAVWAIKLETGHWSIKPEKVEEGGFNKEYTFTIKGEKISKEVKDIRFEYDFGDGGKDARGSAAGTVSLDGTAEIDLSYTYKIPDNLDTTQEEIIYPVTVKIMHGNSMLGSSSAISHIYTGTGTWHPSVTLYSDDEEKLGADRVTIILEYAEGAAPSEQPVPSDVPKAEMTYAWVQVETLDFENAERWAAADAHEAYAVGHGYGPGSYSASTTYEGPDYYKEGLKGTLAVQATFTGIPEVIHPDEPVSINLSFTATKNDVEKLFFTGAAGADFDMWDLDPSGATGGRILFVNADKENNFTIQSLTGPQSYNETLTATLGAGREGGRIALRTHLFQGASMGTNYVYEWKQVN